MDRPAHQQRLRTRIHPKENPLLPPTHIPPTPKRSCLKSSFRWIIILYCSISVLTLTTALFARLHHGIYFISSDFLFFILKKCLVEPPSDSPLDMFSNYQKLSIISSIHPPPISFEPFFWQSPTTPPKEYLTACLWVQEGGRTEGPLIQWASQWKGLPPTSPPPPQSNLTQPPPPRTDLDATGGNNLKFKFTYIRPTEEDPTC